MRRKLVSLLQGGILIIIAWQGAHYAMGQQELILPAPFTVFRAICKHWRLLIGHGYVTTAEALAGFIVGAGTAYGLAILFTLSGWMRDAIYPYAIALKATPIVVLAPLVSVWIGGGFWSKAVLASLVCFFPVLVASFRGLSAFDKDFRNLLGSYGATKLQVLVKLRIPASLPSVFSSLKVASTLAVVGAVIGELTGSDEGIGFLVNTAVYYLEMDLALAAVIAVSLCGVLLFYAIALVEARVIAWAPEYRGDQSS